MVGKDWLGKMNALAGALLKAYCQLTGRPLIEVRYDCGFGNFLSIRGELPTLNWEKGAKMFNLGPHTWFWIVPITAQGPFKILINDRIYEEGVNHTLVDSHGILVHPSFNLQSGD